MRATTAALWALALLPVAASAQAPANFETPSTYNISWLNYNVFSGCIDLPKLAIGLDPVQPDCKNNKGKEESERQHLRKGDRILKSILLEAGATVQLVQSIKGYMAGGGQLLTAFQGLVAGARQTPRAVTMLEVSISENSLGAMDRALVTMQDAQRPADDNMAARALSSVVIASNSTALDAIRAYNTMSEANVKIQQLTTGGSVRIRRLDGVAVRDDAAPPPENIAANAALPSENYIPEEQGQFFAAPRRPGDALGAFLSPEQGGDDLLGCATEKVKLTPVQVARIEAQYAGQEAAVAAHQGEVQQAKGNVQEARTTMRAQKRENWILKLLRRLAILGGF